MPSQGITSAPIDDTHHIGNENEGRKCAPKCSSRHREITQQSAVVATGFGLNSLAGEPLKNGIGGAAVATDCPVTEPEMPENPLKAGILWQKPRFPHMVGWSRGAPGLLPEQQNR